MISKIMFVAIALFLMTFASLGFAIFAEPIVLHNTVTQEGFLGLAICFVSSFTLFSLIIDRAPEVFG